MKLRGPGKGGGNRKAQFPGQGLEKLVLQASAAIKCCDFMSSLSVSAARAYEQNILGFLEEEIQKNKVSISLAGSLLNGEMRMDHWYLGVYSDTSFSLVY